MNHREQDQMPTLKDTSKVTCGKADLISKVLLSSEIDLGSILEGSVVFSNS